MKIFKVFFIIIILILLCFLGITLGAKIMSQEIEISQNTIAQNQFSNYSIPNTIENTIENINSQQENIVEETTLPYTPLDLSGKWITVSAVDTSTWNTIENLSDIFGSSYGSFGSYLQLNKDNTFLDCIYPITSDETSTQGTYTIESDYYSLGDNVIILNYSDGKQYIFKVIYEEENVPLLMQDVSNGEPYQFNLERE